MNAPKRPARTQAEQLEILSNVLALMEANRNFFQPLEQQVIQQSRQWLESRQMPAGELLVQLGAAYQRVKAVQEQVLQQAEEGAAFLVGTDIDTLQMARTLLDSGRFLSSSEFQRLQLVYTKTMLPQILDTLENMALLLQDHEYQLVQYARAMVDIGGGEVDPRTLQALVKIQNSLQSRQYTG